ncbi:TetR/AcrR family transcriptional regulator [Streptomyces sp. NPDC057137]|uniref:TetR/AcrR family transcriptional regulator n=1 Tax=Streptomyces sp. NPDC057137 TaxID=3346030 RepID=UPI003633015D
MAEVLAASGRRKLTPERERELLRVTAELVGEVGYDQVTMAAIARRAKCSTATLYRQWESKPRLVVSAWRAHESERGGDMGQLDTGSLRGDLRGVVSTLTAGDPANHMFASVSAAIAENEGLMEVVREILIHPILENLTQLLDRAVARGEIAAGNPVIGLTPQILLGPWLAQDILYGTHADEELMETILDTVLLPALAPRAAASL